MLKIELTDEERKNLLVFLSRVNMTGAEAKPFIMLVSKIEQAQEVE